MTAQGGPSEFSAAILAEFVKRGVRHVALCPGSRSQALALAAAEFERAGLLTLSVRIDERSAAFLALGIGVESGIPAIVITTSGTAVANLLPAVLEAHHSGVPMILLTADRPEELRGIGSNQTTRQLGMFGDFVQFAREVEAPSVGGFDRAYPGELAGAAFLAATGHSGATGPVHVNMAFREPLSGTFDSAIFDGLAAAIAEPSARLAVATTIPITPNTVVVAGHGAGRAAEETARALGAPLLAEVSSGAHFGRNLVVAYRQLLASEEFGGRVQRVIVFGHPTLSREIPQLIQREGVQTIVVNGQGPEAFNPGHLVTRFVDAIQVVEGQDAADPAWLGSWVTASRELLAENPVDQLANARTDDREAIREFTKAQLAVFLEPVNRRMLVEAVWQKTWPHDRLVFGSSRLIREADRVVVGKNINVHANRGLAGIDGTIATATGIALASQLSSATGRSSGEAGNNAAAGTTRVLLGDLAFLHDVGSLLASPGETTPRMQVIVGNDGGGTIFDSLEVSVTAHKPDFDRVLYTPHTVAMVDLASAYGWNYLRAENRGQLDEALVSPHERTIIEVPFPR
ncbi:MAG: 2-succinyl-5-enolpyruvyl-6-hydroxy-3-cyclohexene-1-carboxylic-acid synthase [Microbacteriaceae bacterium]|nr:2-succinyl-5-enolpyruvyl-6-hydroxy-3-cyclohexene-1-carboxylic-acid synthase [Microbacteriaceae bacterium]